MKSTKGTDNIRPDIFPEVQPDSLRDAWKLLASTEHI